MDQSSLLYVMAVAIGVVALAVLAQAVFLAGIYVSNRKLRQQVRALTLKAEPTLESAQKLLEELRRSVAELSGKTAEVLDLSRQQLHRVDEVLREAAVRSRAQMERIELVLDDVVTRFQETTALVENGIIRPIRHLNGLAAGVRAAVAALVGARTTVAEATHDEEMFI
ncbi:MAG: hypothetical protein RMI94_14700 [Bryobacterales bacterium]|nr:hypothetical protein [Bryobacteraceae bacterium]MDW8131798.1 hypothetical protein [Bryobacterales bacterium]